MPAGLADPAHAGAPQRHCARVRPWEKYRDVPAHHAAVTAFSPKHSEHVDYTLHFPVCQRQSRLWRLPLVFTTLLLPDKYSKTFHPLNVHLPRPASTG
jgi:hypothetical protein